MRMVPSFSPNETLLSYFQYHAFDKKAAHCFDNSVGKSYPFAAVLLQQPTIVKRKKKQHGILAEGARHQSTEKKGVVYDRQSHLCDGWPYLSVRMFIQFTISAGASSWTSSVYEGATPHQAPERAAF